MPGSFSGWGVYCTALLTHLCRSGRYQPVLMGETLNPGNIVLDPLQLKLIEPVLRATIEAQKAGPPAGPFDFDILMAMGNNCVGSFQAGLGRRDIGVIFFEDSNFKPEAVDAARKHHIIVAGCSWCEKILRDRGLTNVTTVLQGVDDRMFHLAPRTGLFKNRFMIFSGGKLEFRKGQDIVLAAFRKFHARHPNAALVTAWHNLWPQAAQGIVLGGLVDSAPQTGANGLLDINGWLAANGLPVGSFLDLGIVPNLFMPQVLREMDAAVFPNRCEGGTNLVAMECMACGLPVVLSANTGHLDIIRPDNCYPLQNQKPVPASIGIGTEGWGQSDPDELVDRLEEIYANRMQALRKGMAAANFMADLNWTNQLDKFLAAAGI